MKLLLICRVVFKEKLTSLAPVSFAFIMNYRIHSVLNKDLGSSNPALKFVVCK